MTSKTKKIKSSGKYGAGYGLRVRKAYNKIQAQKKSEQKSPFHPTGKVKRVAAGIWKCLKTGKVFAGPAYALNQSKA